MLIEVCDTCICRAANNPQSETCKDPHMQNLHAVSYVENSQHFVFRSGRSRGRIGIANGICQRHMFNIWLEVPTRQAQHVPASLAPCILRCDALSTSRRKPSKSGTPFLRASLHCSWFYKPFRQLPNAAPATQTHAQMHRMLRLPRLRQWHLQSAAPATISRAPSRARDNIPSL